MLLLLILVVVILEFESHRCEILNLFATIRKDETAESAYVAWVGPIRRESTRDERAETFSL